MTHVRCIIAAALLSSVVATVVRAAPATQPADLEKENAALKERIEKLEARVKTLERQLRDARAGRGPFILPAPTPAPRRAPESPFMPSPRMWTPAPREGWVEREINGIRFFLVPLKDQ
ncbi:MAG TPA: hypothetical protein VGR35_01355 [Tepidisphaeraceae bacterium]|nr:hypothetical protein [Tepidisphaeraceae bacterium]